MNLDELDKMHKAALTDNWEANDNFMMAMIELWPSLSVRLRATDKFMAAFKACGAAQNEETDQMLSDAIDECDAIK